MHVIRLSLAAIGLLFSLSIALAAAEGETHRKSSPPAVEGMGRILQVDVGGGGRFLILRIENRLAIFDIHLSKIIAHVPLPSENAVVAAGKSVLVIVDPLKKQIQRWSLPEAEKLSESTLDLEMEVGYAAMGAASNGPLLLVPKSCRWPLEEVRLLNLETLQPVVDQFDLLGRAIQPPGGGSPGFATASDDGTAFYIGPFGLLLRVEPGRVEPGRVVGRFCTEIDWTNRMQPGRIGRYLFGWAVPLDQQHAKPRTKLIDQARMQRAEGQVTIHDRGGSFYLSMRPGQEDSVLEAFYMTEGDPDPLGKVPDLMLETGQDHLPVAQRVHLHSQAGVIVTLDDRIGRIDVHRIRPGDVLPPLDPRRLALRSPSRFTVHADQAFTHQVQLVGQGNETKFELVGAPEGLTIDASGVLRWLPPELGKDMTIQVDLQASLGENQVVHRLAIAIRSSRVRSGDDQAGSMSEGRGAVAKWLIDPPTTTWLAETAFTKPHDDPVKLKVESRPSMIRPAAEGRVLVFRQSGSIAIVNVQSGKLIARLPAPHTGTQFATGLECVIVHDPIDQTLTRWRLSDLSVSHQVQAPFEGEARQLLLGASSSGPLMVEAMDSKSMYRFDSQSLVSLAMPKLHDPNQRPNLRPTPVTVTGIAENGTTLSGTRGNDLISLVPMGTEYQVHALRQIRSGTVRMSSDGNYSYFGESIFDRDWQSQQSKVSSGVIFPAVSGPLFCGIRGERHQVGTTFRPKYGYKIHAEIYHPSLAESISRLNDVMIREPEKNLTLPNLDHEQIWIVPSVNRLVRFDSRTTEFVFHHWDIRAALERVQTLLPIIMSSPHVWVRLGSQWSYQLQAFPRGKINYRISVAPDGMKLSEDAVVTWEVPADLTEGKHRVIIVAISEYGKEENHAFDLHVLR